LLIRGRQCLGLSGKSKYLQGMKNFALHFAKKMLACTFAHRLPNLGCENLFLTDLQFSLQTLSIVGLIMFRFLRFASEAQVTGVVMYDPNGSPGARFRTLHFFDIVVLVTQREESTWTMPSSPMCYRQRHCISYFDRPLSKCSPSAGARFRTLKIIALFRYSCSRY